MLLLPKSLTARLLALAWLSLCLGVLAFGIVQRDIHDMPIAFILFMHFLSIPVGLLVIPIVGLTTSIAFSALGASYNPILDLLPIWVAAVVFGYLQWFVAIPWIFRKIFPSKSRA